MPRAKKKAGPPVAVPLIDFIRDKYKGNKSAFAKDFGLYRQNVNKLIEKGVLVIDGVLYRPLIKWSEDDKKAA